MFISYFLTLLQKYRENALDALVVIECFTYFYVDFKCILCPNKISELFKIFCIECLGIALSGIQVWCKRFEGNRRCDNFYLLT